MTPALCLPWRRLSSAFLGASEHGASSVLASPVLASSVLASPVLASPVLASPVLTSPVLAGHLTVVGGSSAVESRRSLAWLAGASVRFVEGPETPRRLVAWFSKYLL